MKSRAEATALDEVKYPCLGNKKIDSCGAPLSKNISRYTHSFSTKKETLWIFKRPIELSYPMVLTVFLP